MDKELLYVSMIFAGATHGGYMTFTPIFTRAKFGLDNMGKILGFLTTGAAIGSILIADFVLPYFMILMRKIISVMGRDALGGVTLLLRCVSL
jgi:hypothetical protein